MDPADTALSKRISLALRHRPDAIGIELDAHGWVEVARLLDALGAAGPAVTRADLVRVVASNDKRRFEIDAATDRIRARQGHSVPVDLDLAPATPPDVLFHGTPRRNVESILATGLDRRGRHHVHLSADVETAARVGARRGDFVVLEVDATAMAAAGHRFWRTENGVWLTDAVAPGFLLSPPPPPAAVRRTPALAPPAAGP